MRRIWLHNVGLFEVIPNSGNGSCLFQAISQALTFSQQHHYKIRRAVVEHMTSKKWKEKLHELPVFWKHKIITNWLNKERSFLGQQEGQNYSSNIFIKFLQLCVFKWLQKFVESKRNRKYIRIKGLLQRKRIYPKYLDDFKFVFRKFMLQIDEPATRFELEAAADKFHFHFDYLQTIPITSKNLTRTQIKLTSSIQNDILNNNVPDDTNELIKTTCDDDDDKNSMDDHISVPVKMSLYQFHSCRTCGCKLPRGSPTFEHYYFLHSPLVANDDSYSKTNTSNRVESSPLMEPEGNCCWHWELLLPIFVRRNPMPLNRRIFGLSYEISDSSRNFTFTHWGQNREIQDTVASAIETFIQKNPEIIPPEDSRWPADEVDDFSGCAQTLEDSVYYVNAEEEEKYCSSSRRVVSNRDNIIKELLRL